MRSWVFGFLTFCLVCLLDSQLPAQLFEVPLRINMGGPTRTDSNGNVWLGESVGDTLDILSDDGVDYISCGTGPSADDPNMPGFDFDPAEAEDRALFAEHVVHSSVLSSGFFQIEIPIDEDSYTVNLYFLECFNCNRHFDIRLEGRQVAQNVSTCLEGGLNTAGRLSFDVYVGADEVLDIDLPACTNAVLCPGGGDHNAGGVSLIEVLPCEGQDCPTGEENPCDDSNFKICPQNLNCVISGENEITGTWEAPPPPAESCITLTGYELRLNGQVIDTLDASATSFIAAPKGRQSVFELIPMVQGQERNCDTVTCVVSNPLGPFDIPARVNIGGPVVVDSEGNIWLSDDRSFGLDPLDIRPDDNVDRTPFWCDAAPGTDSAFLDLGFDPSHVSDRSLFSSAAYYANGAPGTFALEMPMDEGSYTVNLYFMECSGCSRHFKVLLENLVFAEDVSSCLEATLRTPGRLSFDVYVDDGGLTVGLPACVPPTCPAGGDLNSGSLNAIEVLPCEGPDCPTGGEDPCENPDFKICPGALVCESLGGVDSVTVVGNWRAPPPPELSCIRIVEYELRRNGEVIETLGPEDTTFMDELEDRQGLYELVPFLEDGKTCPPLTCVVNNPNVTFSLPLRINIGGLAVVDSNGNFWLSDSRDIGPDPLNIYTNDDMDRLSCILGPRADNPEMSALGFDPMDPNDRAIFSGWAYHISGNSPNEIVVPLENDVYNVNLYFMECFNCSRHFDILFEGGVVAANVSSCLDGGTLTPGRLSFESVAIADGALNIELPACVDPVDCPGGGDLNSGSINAIEILGSSVATGACCNAGGCDVLTEADCMASGGDYRGDGTDCGGANCPEGVLFRRGDCDQSGEVDFNDAIFHLKFLFLGENEDEMARCPDACDSDDSGDDDFTDDINLLKFLFLGQGDIPPPGPLPDESHPCGLDPTVGDMTDCVEYSSEITCP